MAELDQPPSCIQDMPAGDAGDAKMMARFIREARIASKAETREYCFGEWQGVEAQTPYYAMEFVEGETLADFPSEVRTREPRAQRNQARTPEASAYGSVADVCILVSRRR